MIADIGAATGPLRIGVGLVQSGSSICATKAGFLRQKRARHFLVDTSQKTYIPCLEDFVIGIVRFRRGKEEEYDIDINSHYTASLPVIAFEGATRKNMAPLKVGSVNARFEVFFSARFSCLWPYYCRKSAHGALYVLYDCCWKGWRLWSAFGWAYVSLPDFSLSSVCFHAPVS